MSSTYSQMVQKKIAFGGGVKRKRGRTCVIKAEINNIKLNIESRRHEKYM